METKKNYYQNTEFTMYRIGDHLWISNATALGDSEEEIFENHFGGVYYVFARGCRSGEASGLYAQTWKNYEDLKKEYLVLKKMMRA